MFGFIMEALLGVPTLFLTPEVQMLGFRFVSRVWCMRTLPLHRTSPNCSLV